MYKILKEAALCGFFKVHPIINIIFAIMVIGFGIRKDEPFGSQPSYQGNGFGIRKDEPFGSRPSYQDNGFGIRKDEPFSSQPSYQDNGFGIRKDEPFGSQPPYPGGFSDNVQFGQGY